MAPRKSPRSQRAYKPRKYSRGEIIRNRIIVGGIYAGALVSTPRGRRFVKKAYRVGLKARRVGLKAALKKTKPYKKVLGKYMIAGGRGKTGRRFIANLRQMSMLASTVKRRNAVAKTSKRMIKAGRGSNAALKRHLSRRYKGRR